MAGAMSQASAPKQMSFLEQLRLSCEASRQCKRPFAPLEEIQATKQSKSQRLQQEVGDSENLAKQFFESGNINAEAVLKVLLATDIPMSGTRKNVLPDGVHAVRGMLLGFYACATNIGITEASKSHPWLVRLLSSFARKSHPDFEFTSIQVNKNYASRAHVDKNNLGDSLIIGLGNYSGGDLWVHSDAGKEAFELQEDVPSMYHYKAGATYPGSLLDLRGQWRYFNGNRLHYTRPFEGDRFTLVYYTCSRYPDAPLLLFCSLRAAGFPISKSSQKLQKALHEKEEEGRQCNEKWKQQTVQNRIRKKLAQCHAQPWNKASVKF